MKLLRYGWSRVLCTPGLRVLLGVWVSRGLSISVFILVTRCMFIGSAWIHLKLGKTALHKQTQNTTPKLLFFLFLDLEIRKQNEPFSSVRLPWLCIRPVLQSALLSSQRSLLPDNENANLILYCRVL